MNFLEGEKPSKDLFIFLKYNKIAQKEKDEIKLNKNDEQMYKEFVSKWSLLQDAFANDSDKASSLLGGLMMMFGFNRHYCGTCGSPILGRYTKIGSKIACVDCYESLRIIQQMEKTEERTKKHIRQTEATSRKNAKQEAADES